MRQELEEAFAQREQQRAQVDVYTAQIAAMLLLQQLLLPLT